MGFGHNGLDMFMKNCEVALEDHTVSNVEEERSSVLVIKMNMQITNKGITILEKMRNLLWKGTRERLASLRGIEKHRLLEATRKLDEVMKKIEVGNITEMNDVSYAGLIVVTEMF